MSNPITIIYPDTRKQHRAKDFRIVYYDLVDEKTCQIKNTKCVEFTVVGNFSEWPMGYPYNSFIFFNPQVEEILSSKS